MYTVKDFYRRTIGNAFTPYAMLLGVWFIAQVFYILFYVANDESNESELLFVVGFFGALFFIGFIAIQLIEKHTELNKNIRLVKKAYIKKEARRLFNHSPNYRTYLKSKTNYPDEILNDLSKIQPHILNLEHHIETNKKYDSEFNHYKGVTYPIEYFTTLIMIPSGHHSHFEWFIKPIIELSELSDEYVYLLTLDQNVPLNSRRIRVIEGQIGQLLKYIRQEIPKKINLSGVDHIKDLPDPIIFQEEVAYAVYDSKK